MSIGLSGFGIGVLAGSALVSGVQFFYAGNRAKAYSHALEQIELAPAALVRAFKIDAVIRFCVLTLGCALLFAIRTMDAGVTLVPVAISAAFGAVYLVDWALNRAGPFRGYASDLQRFNDHMHLRESRRRTSGMEWAVRLAGAGVLGAVAWVLYTQGFDGSSMFWIILAWAGATMIGAYWLLRRFVFDGGGQ